MSRVTKSAKARIVLLGASNLTRAISTVLGLARSSLELEYGEPLDALIAYGHGRSYGIDSTVLARTLPGIVECRLWHDLESLPPVPTYALLTDVGNDIMYGIEPELLKEWLEQCLDRLQHCRSSIVMTALPMEGIRKLRQWEYRIVKAILFPRHKITYRQALARAEVVDGLLRALAARRHITLVEPSAEWYGFDPIHIRPIHRHRAWSRFLAAWRAGDDPPTTRASLRRFIALRTTLPQRVRLFGRERMSPQPACHLPDGTTVAMY